MSIQRDLHTQAIRHLEEVKYLIDRLNAVGPCPEEGDNAILNVRDRLDGLKARLPPDSRIPGSRR